MSSVNHVMQLKLHQPHSPRNVWHCTVRFYLYIFIHLYILACFSSTANTSSCCPHSADESLLCLRWHSMLGLLFMGCFFHMNLWVKIVKCVDGDGSETFRKKHKSGSVSALQSFRHPWFLLKDWTTMWRRKHHTGLKVRLCLLLMKAGFRFGSASNSHWKENRK